MSTPQTKEEKTQAIERSAEVILRNVQSALTLTVLTGMSLRHSRYDLEKAIDIFTTLGKIRMTKPHRVVATDTQGKRLADSTSELQNLLLLPEIGHNFAHFYCGMIPHVQIQSFHPTGPFSVTGYLNESNWEPHLNCSLEITLLWRAQPALNLNDDVSIEIRSNFAKLMWNAESFL